MTIAERKSQATRYTAAEYLALPVDEGCRTELVQGEVIVSPRPTYLHSYTLGRLFILISSYVTKDGLGGVHLEIDAVFGDREVRSPDIIYFPKGKMPTGAGRDPAVMPDLCVEVISPWNVRTDRVDKYRLYESRGVERYWMVDPANRVIEAYELVGGKYLASGRGAGADILRLAPFPGMEISLLQLWHP